MSTAMRAKMYVQNVQQHKNADDTVASEMLAFTCVCDSPFGPNGESDDNTFARWTPSGAATYQVSNPALFGKFEQGKKYYVDFTPAE